MIEERVIQRVVEIGADLPTKALADGDLFVGGKLDGVQRLAAYVREARGKGAQRERRLRLGGGEGRVKPSVGRWVELCSALCLRQSIALAVGELGAFRRERGGIGEVEREADLRVVFGVEIPAAQDCVENRMDIAPISLAAAERHRCRNNQGELLRRVELIEALLQRCFQKVREIDVLVIQNGNALECLGDRVCGLDADTLREPASQFHLRRMIALAANRDVGDVYLSELWKRKERLGTRHPGAVDGG